MQKYRVWEAMFYQTDEIILPDGAIVVSVESKSGIRGHEWDVTYLVEIKEK